MGATLCFDDAEKIMDPKKGDPDKQALLLAGNRRGLTVPMKDKLPNDQGWYTRQVRVFCMRAFSAINLPDRVLASRSINFPLVRSLDGPKMDADPLDTDQWPSDRRALIDDLWATGLAGLTELPDYDRRAAARATLSGRNLQPWRNVLALALWLEEKHGAAELFSRIEGLSVAYQKERQDLEAPDRIRVMLMALGGLVRESPLADPVTFLAKDLAERTNRVARELGLVSEDKAFVSAQSVGHRLRDLRFKRDEKKVRGAQPWAVTQDRYAGLASSYSVDPEGDGQSPAAAGGADGSLLHQCTNDTNDREGSGEFPFSPDGPADARRERGSGERIA